VTFCECCCDYSDRFNRANSGSLGSDWVVESGTWSILSSQLHVTTSTGAVTWQTAASRDGGVQSARVKILPENSVSSFGRVIRLILGRVDANNYIAAELTNGNGSDTTTDGHLAIVVRQGGVETKYYSRYFTSFFSTSTPAYLWATLTPTPDLSAVECTARVGASAYHLSIAHDVYRAGLPYLGGTMAGLEVTAGTGNVEFDDFSFPYAVTEPPAASIQCVDIVPFSCGAFRSSGTTWSLADEARLSTTAHGHTVTITRMTHNRGEPRWRTKHIAGVNTDFADLHEVYTDWQDATNHHYCTLTFGSPTSLGAGLFSIVATLQAFKGGASVGSTTATLTYLLVGASKGNSIVIDWCMDNSSHTIVCSFGTLAGIGGPANSPMTLSFTSTPYTDPSNTTAGGWFGNNDTGRFVTASGIGNGSSPYDDGTCDAC
jgi:hypothetical protein